MTAVAAFLFSYLKETNLIFYFQTSFEEPHLVWCSVFCQDHSLKLTNNIHLCILALGKVISVDQLTYLLDNGEQHCQSYSKTANTKRRNN